MNLKRFEAESMGAFILIDRLNNAALAAVMIKGAFKRLGKQTEQ
jgi:sulfate adenylyltransferase subunit 1 (EFTu-like GTPase family)